MPSSLSCLVKAHAPIIDIDIWERVRRYFPSDFTRGSRSISAFLSPGMLLRVPY